MSGSLLCVSIVSVARTFRAAGRPELQRRTLYLRTLASCSQRSRESYKNAAADMLKSIEQDIVKRAVTAGLVIGLNRSPLIDTLSIVAPAFGTEIEPGLRGSVVLASATI
jgi:hypothetical protein